MGVQVLREARLILLHEEPKGPSRTKNTTDSKFTIRGKFATAIVQNTTADTLKQLFLKGKIKQQIASRNSKKKATAVVKYYGIESRSVFSTEGWAELKGGGQNVPKSKTSRGWPVGN